MRYVAKIKKISKKYFKALILLALIVLVFLVWGGGHIFSSHRTFSYNVLPGASVGSVANDLHDADKIGFRDARMFNGKCPIKMTHIEMPDAIDVMQRWYKSKSKKKY